jgi:carbon monoxide dehydrogenase subunit G
VPTAASERQLAALSFLNSIGSPCSPNKWPSYYDQRGEHRTMKITGEQTIAARPEKVWQALNDTEVLRQSIPGCKSLERISDRDFKATVETKIGPIKALFNGDVQLSDPNPPHGYTLSGRGSAGSIGNAKGSARVQLIPNGAGTKLTYDVDADVTGKFAQLGSRLIQSTANSLAGQFFTRFGELVGEARADGKAPAPRKVAMPWWVWTMVAAAIAAAIIYLLR